MLSQKANKGTRANGVDGSPSAPRTATSGRLIAKNTVWNLIGFASPMLVGLFAIPYLINGFGKDRFGLLSILWMAVGYFGLFDMGFGRALTKLVAEQLEHDPHQDMDKTIWTALWVVFVLGCFGAVLVSCLSNPLITRLLNVPENLQSEGIISFRLLALGLPLVIGTSALVGILQAHQRFALITAIRVPLGLATFLGPVVSFQFSDNLVWAALFLLTARLVAFLVYYAAAARISTALMRPQKPTWSKVGPLMRFGGWLTVSTVVGPVMLYSDRFLIGSMMTMTAVTYYTTPYEVLSRGQVLPQALFGVLFPALAAAYAGNIDRLRELYDHANRALLLTMLPPMAMAFLFAPELLQMWLGHDFSVAATSVTRWLIIGWLHVMMARTNSTVLQATGRPDLLAKAHISELLPFLGVLWFAINHFGIAGAAMAWCLRGVVDAIALTLLTGAAVPTLRERALLGLRALPLLWLVFAVLAMAGALIAKIAIAALIFALSVCLLFKPVRWLLSTRASS